MGFDARKDGAAWEDLGVLLGVVLGVVLGDCLGDEADGTGAAPRAGLGDGGRDEVRDGGPEGGRDDDCRAADADADAVDEEEVGRDCLVAVAGAFEADAAIDAIDVDAIDTLTVIDPRAEPLGVPGCEPAGVPLRDDATDEERDVGLEGRVSPRDVTSSVNVEVTSGCSLENWTRLKSNKWFCSLLSNSCSSFSIKLS